VKEEALLIVSPGLLLLGFIHRQSALLYRNITEADYESFNRFDTWMDLKRIRNRFFRGTIRKSGGRRPPL